MHELGFTRSAHHRDHLLQTPDTFVRTPLPGLIGGTAVMHAGPQMGAAFAMMTVELEDGGTLPFSPTQRFLYVLEGELQGLQLLSGGHYAYLPPGYEEPFRSRDRSRICVIEKRYEPLLTEHELGAAGRTAAPTVLMGSEAKIASNALGGDDDVQVRSLLPPDPVFDFAVNTMTYAPGAALSQVEVHYMEHGLLMLEGAGIYRLGDAWYPVRAGDFIWMGAFCPQWFGCIGKQPAKYLIYKNFNRHALA